MGQTSLHLGQFHRAGFAASSTVGTEEHLLPNKDGLLTRHYESSSVFLVVTGKLCICSTQLGPSLDRRRAFGSHAGGRWRASLLSLHRHILLSVGVRERGTGSSPFTCPDPTHPSKNLSVIGITPPPCAFLSRKGAESRVSQVTINFWEGKGKRVKERMPVFHGPSHCLKLYVELFCVHLSQ